MLVTNRLVTLANNYDRHKLSDEFPLELLTLDCLKLIFDIVPCIAIYCFASSALHLLITRKHHEISNKFKIVQFASELLILER